MNAGKVLIGTAMLVFSLALMVTPSGGAPAGDALPFWQEPGQGPGPSLAGCIPERESMTGTAGQAMPAATVEDGGPRIVRDAPRAWNRSSLQPYRACCPVPAHCDKGCPV